MARSLHRLYKKHQVLPIKLGIAATFMLIPLWYRFPGTKALGMGDFTVFYSAGFLIFWPMLWTVIWWALSGFSGINIMWRERTQRRWFILLLIFSGWILLSWTWSYKRDSYPSVAISAAIPFMLALAFSIAVSCTRISLRTLMLTLVFGLIWNSVIASIQVAIQGSIGLTVLGEFRVNPAASGTAIVQAGGIRWLRPYSLLPHPNMLGGFLVIAILASLTWAMIRRDKRWLLAVSIFTFGLWSLLLTFSRSAWLGLGAGGLVLLVLTFQSWWFDRQRLMRLVVIVGISLTVGGAFLLIYQPFLAARAGVGDESIELRSTSDRAVYNEIAFDAIKQSPILGTGIGNFPWYASKYLSKTDFDLKGQPVHNIYLSAWSEVGIIGLGLFLLIVGFAIRIGIRNVNLARKTQADNVLVYASFIGGIIAFLVIGLFDHYSWTLIQFQAAFWGMMAVVIQPPSLVSNSA